MPWRGEKNPYLIWLSEVILQQTRVNQGRPYYEHFVKTYPTVESLASASEQEVLKSWEGLGYYSRARNLHKAAKAVSQELDGKFPKDFVTLQGLPGIGEYTAAAIASICYAEAVAVVDGNVNRLMSRLFAIQEDVYSSSGKRQIRHHAQSLLEQGAQPGEFNQAMMEFAAIHCVPKSPDCTNCSLSAHCAARAKGLVAQLPFRRKSKPIKHRYFTYHVALDKGFTYVRKRAEQDIWQGLYEFALEESNTPDKPIGIPEESLIASEAFEHILSHQKIHARFIIYRGKVRVKNSQLERVSLKQLGDLPFSRLSTKFMEKTKEIWESEKE